MPVDATVIPAVRPPCAERERVLIPELVRAGLTCLARTREH
jgi:hypothetical protein